MAALVHNSPTQGAAAHALVIGVGDYPHLKDGKGTKFSAHENMGQLTSAPVSARRFAEWLIAKDGYHDPARPLASVRLLLSEKTRLRSQSRFKNSATGETHSVPLATLAEVEAATRDWAKALKENEEHLGLFFFSGHGVMSGFEQALLLSDFGDDKDLLPTKYAIRFNQFRTGMKWIAAREQCYFVDACRSYSPAFAEAHGATGEAIIGPDKNAAFSRQVQQPVFNATLEGEPAFGRTREPSVFTAALLWALRGGGADDVSGPDQWRIDAAQLQRSIEFIIKRSAEREKMIFTQISSGENMTAVTMGELRGPPLVPVKLCCAPDDATALAEFVYPVAKKWLHGQPDPLIDYGKHQFEATFSDGGYLPGTVQLEIRPPYRTVSITVSKC